MNGAVLGLAVASCGSKMRGSDFQDRLDHTSFRAQPLAEQGGGVIETTAMCVQRVGWNLARPHLAYDLGEVARLGIPAGQERRFPLVEVCRKLEHIEVIAIDPAMRPLFRDVTDHIRRVQEEIDALREVLAFAFEASQLMGQARQTEVTRKLAAWAAILAVPTAIAGIYGMNFKYIPEIEWTYGYFVVMPVIFLMCALLYWRFRRDRWL